jgi:hypothetical protein
MSDTADNVAVEWVTLDDAPNHPTIRQLIPTQRAWYWELGKPDFKRSMVEAGAIIKIGKSWRVSLTKAPAAIEGIYRAASLAAIDRAAQASKPKRQRSHCS